MSTTPQIDFSKYEQQTSTPQIDFTKYAGGPSSNDAENARAMQNQRIQNARTAMEASGAMPKGSSGHPDYIPGLASPGSQPIPKPIEYAIRATPYLTGVESVPALITAARTAAGGYVGGKVARGATEALGGGETAQTVADVGGSLLGGFAAGTGLPRAFLETPMKEFAAKNGTTLLDLLQPRKALIGKLTSLLADTMEKQGAKAATEAAPAASATLNSATESAASGLDKPVLAAAKAPEPTYLSTPKPAPRGAPKLEMPIVNPNAQAPLRAPVAAGPKTNTDLLEGLREWHQIRQIHTELERQIGIGQEEVDTWMQAHNQAAPGGKAPAPAEADSIEELLRKSIEQVKAQKAAALSKGAAAAD